MYAVPVHANTIVVQAPNGNRFDTTLPARLVGVISAPEYSASIARCNAAIAPGMSYYLSRLLLLAGLAVWGACWGSAWSNRDRYGSIDPTIMFAGIGAMAAAMILGSVWANLERRNRIQALQAAVAGENDYYNSHQRAAQYGPLPLPMSWTMAMSVIGGWYRRRHLATMINIHIDLGGPMMMPVAAAAPVGAQAAAPGVYVQPQFAQPAGQFQQYPQALHAQPPAYGSPWPNQPEGQAAPQGQAENIRAPLLAGGTNSGGGYGGQQMSAASCERCGRVASNAVDRFCSACGGPVSRR